MSFQRSLHKGAVWAPDGRRSATTSLLIQHISPHLSSIIHRFADEAKRLLQDDIIAEYLFGSYAQNTYTPLSDIDILILVKNFTPDMQRQLSGLAAEYPLSVDLSP